MFADLFNTVSALIIATLIANSAANLDKDLVIGFLKAKGIRFGYIFDCLPIKERIKLTKFLMTANLEIALSGIKRQNLVFGSLKDSLFHHLGIIVDGDCNDVDNLLKSAEESFLFDDTHHWLIVASNASFFNKFRNLPLYINSNLYVAIPNVKNGNKMQNWIISDVYNPAYKHGGELKIDYVGFYSNNQVFDVTQQEYKYWTRRNMTGVTLKTMAVLRQHFQIPIEEYLQRDNNRRMDSFAKFQYRLIQHCQQLYNFSLKIIKTETWRYEYEKGKFDGLSGALQRKEVDFGCTALYVKPERIPIMDYAVGLWRFRVIFVFRQPHFRSFGQVFLHPMSTSVWLATLAAALVIIITLRLCQIYELNIIKTLKDSLDQTWSTLILFTLGAFCQQGCPQTPTSSGGRIITLSILTFCLLFYQFYSGTIVSFLLTKPPPTIKSPEDLLESSLKVGSDGAPYIKDYFLTTSDPVGIELYRRKMIAPGNSANYYSNEYGLHLVEQGGFAYQVEITAGYIDIEETFSDKAICELGEVQMFPTQRLMTVVQKNSPFRDMFNYCMLRLAEHGIGDYQQTHWGARKPECLESSTSVSIEVNLREIYPAIVLLFIGILISLIVLGLEILTQVNYKEKQNKNMPP